MANRRFIDFPIATTVGDSDIILIWQSGVNKQTTKATFLSGLPENLDELNDVAISGLTNGQILRYDSVTGKWENTDQGNLDLNDLNDVSIVSPSNGQVLVYNSSTSKWENSSGGFVPYTGAVTTVNLGAQTIQAGQFVKAGGTSSQFLKADGSIDSTAYGTGSVTSVGLTMPSAFSVANSPVTTAGTLAVTGAGTVSQYIRGDGSLADFPESSGGGSSVSYYLNGSVNQGTIGGVAYKELSKVPILGAGTDFTINANGYIASFLTDAGDPNLLEIPGGNWNFETYFSANSGGGSPSFYVELYKVNSGGTATLLASNSGFPELIAFGTNIISYFSTLAVPTTTLALTDRLAIRYYVTHSGRTITLHTEDNHLCQIITTFTTGITALNGLTAQVQNFAVGTSGTDFAISSATATHTFNLPTASATNRGALSSADWTTFNNKENAITAGTTAQYFRGDKTFQTLNTSVVPESGNLYFTNARAIASVLTGYVSGAGIISAADTILSAIQKLNGNIGALVTGVSSVNGLTGAVTLTTTNIAEGTNLYYTEARVNANANVAANTAARHNAVTLGTANGLSLSTQVLSLGLASAGVTGALSGTDWSTFNNKQNALGYTPVPETRTITINGTTQDLSANRTFNVGTVTSVGLSSATSGVTIGSTPVTGSGTITLAIATASGSQNGLLSSTDWTTFNSKQNALTNPVTGTGAAGRVAYWNGSGTITSDSLFQWNDFSKRLGIGRTPTVSLDVEGAGFFSGTVTASSIIKSGGTSSQYLMADGSVSTLTNPVTGTGTTNYLPKFTGTSTIGNSQIFDNGTNVGIGTASVSGTYEKLAVAGGISIKDNTNAKLEIGRYNTTGAQNSYIKLGANSNSLRFTNNTDIADLMELTNSGNLGLGVTPSAWGSNYKVLQIGNAAFWSQTSGSTGTFVSQNAFFDGASWKYISNGFANVYIQTDTGKHEWLNAASGTAGNSIGFSVPMTLTSGGNLLVGTTTDNGQRLQVSGGLFVNNGGNEGIFISNGTTNSSLQQFDNALYLNSNSNSATQGSFIFRSSNSFTTRMVINTSGNVGIGTTSPSFQLHVNRAGNTGIFLSNTTGNSAGYLFAGGLDGLEIQSVDSSNSTAKKLNIQPYGGNVLIGTTTDPGAKLHVNGDIRTAAPSGGSAVNWKLGTARGGTITPNAIVRVEIAGVLVDLDARYV